MNETRIRPDRLEKVQRRIRCHNPESLNALPELQLFPEQCIGENFRAWLEAHPVYINPVSSLAGTWIGRYRDWGLETIGYRPAVGALTLRRRGA